MIKSVKTLLTLRLYLLSILFQPDGYAFYKSNFASLATNRNCFTLQKSQASGINSALSTTKGQQRQNHVTDSEEKGNKITSFKSYSVFSTDLPTSFCNQLVESLFRNTNIQLFFSKYLSYYPSCKSLYLLFETMQI